MGLRPGEHIERLALLEIVSNRREALLEVTAEDVAREGFPGIGREDFVGLFLRINPTMTRFQRVSRIEFKYVEDDRDAG